MQLLKSIKKNFIDPILQEIAVNLFKSIIATGIFGAGVALMTNSIVGGILIAIGLLFILWLVKSWINETKRDDDIKDRVFITKVLPIIEYNTELKTHGIVFNIYFANCTSQIISIIIDPTRTKIVVNGKIRPVTKYPTKTLFPYQYNDGIRTYYTDYNKDKDEKEFDAHLNIALEYSIANSSSKKYEILKTCIAKYIIAETDGKLYIKEEISYDLKDGLVVTI